MSLCLLTLLVFSLVSYGNKACDHAVCVHVYVCVRVRVKDRQKRKTPFRVLNNCWMHCYLAVRPTTQIQVSMIIKFLQVLWKQVATKTTETSTFSRLQGAAALWARALLGTRKSTQDRAVMNGPTTWETSIKTGSKTWNNPTKSAVSVLVPQCVRHSGDVPSPVFPGES